MNDITPKTSAAFAGGSMSVALVSVLEWILGFWHVSITATAAAGVATLLAGGAAWLAPRSHLPASTDIDVSTTTKSEQEKWNTQK